MDRSGTPLSMAIFLREELIREPKKVREFIFKAKRNTRETDIKGYVIEITLNNRMLAANPRTASFLLDTEELVRLRGATLPSQLKVV